jgi:alkaline phosphatase D
MEGKLRAESQRALRMTVKIGARIRAKNHASCLSRRSFLAKAGGAIAASALFRPAIGRAADRPSIIHGVQSGDVSADGAVVWSRSDRPSRMIVEAALSDSFRDIRQTVYADALPESDFTAKILLGELPAGETVFYRVRFQDLSFPTLLSEARVGRFRVPDRAGRTISFTWSGDVAGQGWGIDESRDGMRGFAAMRDNRPDFFIHSGDGIYADCPIEREVKLPDGGVWRNLVTEDKGEVAQTLAQFRGNYKYNLLDRHLLAFNAEVPILAQWDDHEVTNDWWPGGRVEDSHYTQNSALLLAARGRRAFREYVPLREPQMAGDRIYRKIGYGPLLDVFLIDMRSYRAPNDAHLNGGAAAPVDLLGRQQLAWLKRELAGSGAVWKVIAADLPLGLVSQDAVALGDGPPHGREYEIADLLSSMRAAGVANVVWLTADMHYTAAHYYDPNRAVFQDFDPFYEFVSGPLHAGTWHPAPLDNTFGPRILFQKGCDASQPENLAPCFGLQFFGRVDIDGDSGVMTVSLKNIADQVLWSTEITPKRRERAAVDNAI